MSSINTVNYTTEEVHLNTVVLRGGQAEIVPVGSYMQADYDHPDFGNPRGQRFQANEEWGGRIHNLAPITSVLKSGNIRKAVDHATVLAPILDSGWQIEKAVHNNNGIAAHYTLSLPSNLKIDNFVHWSDKIWADVQAAHKGDSAIQHVLYVNASIDPGSTITLQEGFMYTWCANGARRLMNLFSATFKHGEWSADAMMGSMNKGLRVPHYSELEVAELPQLLSGKGLGATNDGRLQSISNVVYNLRESSRRNGPDFHWDAYGPTATGALKTIGGQATWYQESLAIQLSEAAKHMQVGQALRQVDGDTIATNAFNWYQQTNPENDHSPFLQHQRIGSVADAVNTLIEIF